MASTSHATQNAPTTAGDAPLPANSVRVTVDMYSGRENFSWIDDHTGAAIVNTCLNAGGEQIQASSIPSGLGFRAFVIDRLPASSGWQKVEVTKDTVEAVNSAGQITRLECTTLYPSLRAVVAAHLTADEYAQIPAD